MLLFDVVGFGEVFQQTPRAVTEELPAFVTFPPQNAEFEVMLVTELVVTVGEVAGGVVKVT